MTGSSRVVGHTTFAELGWRRDEPDHYFRLPPGFEALAWSRLLPDRLIDVLEDTNALQCIREAAGIVSMKSINNHQASIQSRLAELQYSSPILECCCLAAYLCSSMLCCTVWCASVIPVRQLHGLIALRQGRSRHTYLPKSFSLLA
jgi:hypothetical protein